MFMYIHMYRMIYMHMYFYLSIFLLHLRTFLFLLFSPFFRSLSLVLFLFFPTCAFAHAVSVMHIHTHLNTRAHTNTRTHTHTQTHAQTHTLTHTHTHTNTHTHKHTHTPPYTQTHIVCVPVYMCICIDEHLLHSTSKKINSN